MKNKNSKLIAITGSTGGLGKVICQSLASRGESLILLDRSIKKSEEHRVELLKKYPGANIRCVACDLEDMDSVRKATDILIESEIDAFVHNAGAYKITWYKCTTGYDNVFQINFASPYYMIKKLLPTVKAKKGTVVAVGSVAHTYSKIFYTYY